MKTTNSRTALTVVMKALALPALLVLALAMLAPGGGTNSTEPGYAPGDQPAPENWAAVGWQEVSKSEADKLTFLWYGGPAPTWDEVKAGSARTLRLVTWVKTATHPLMDSLLPGVRFYLVRDRHMASTANPVSYPVALRDGKFYRLDRLNYLLRDAGFKFDTTEMAAIAKIAVLFALLEKYPRTDSVSAATAFPAVEFRKVDGGEVECLVNGARRTFGLVTERVYRVPGRVPTRLYDGDQPVQDFLSPPIKSLWEGESGSSRPLDDMPWTLAISGSTWVETEGAVNHHFLLAAENGKNLGHFPHCLGRTRATSAIYESSAAAGGRGGDASACGPAVTPSA